MVPQKLKKKNFLAGVFWKTLKFNILNFTFLRNMGKDCLQLKTWRKNGRLFLKLRAVELTILIYWYLKRSLAWFIWTIIFNCTYKSMRNIRKKQKHSLKLRFSKHVDYSKEPEESVALKFLVFFFQYYHFFWQKCY